MKYRNFYLEHKPFTVNSLELTNIPHTNTPHAHPTNFRGHRVTAPHETLWHVNQTIIKAKRVFQMICDTCGPDPIVTTERRSGPRGPRTLCNACGLRYAKAKKREADIIANEEDRIRTKMAVSSLLN